MLVESGPGEEWGPTWGAYLHGRLRLCLWSQFWGAGQLHRLPLVVPVWHLVYGLLVVQLTELEHHGLIVQSHWLPGPEGHGHLLGTTSVKVSHLQHKHSLRWSWCPVGLQRRSTLLQLTAGRLWTLVFHGNMATPFINININSKIKCSFIR